LTQEFYFGTREFDDGNGRIVVVGASHMCRLAKQVPADTVVLAVAGFKPAKDSVAEIREKLERLSLGKSDTVVMDLLSNMAFMGTSEEGIPIPAMRGQDSKFHIAGH
jgi:hypothetical protein